VSCHYQYFSLQTSKLILIIFCLFRITRISFHQREQNLNLYLEKRFEAYSHFPLYFAFNVSIHNVFSSFANHHCHSARRATPPRFCKPSPFHPNDSSFFMSPHKNWKITLLTSQISLLSIVVELFNHFLNQFNWPYKCWTTANCCWVNESLKKTIWQVKKTIF